MEGTLKRNNVLEPLSPYGCWSATPKPRVEWTRVWHGGALEDVTPQTLDLMIQLGLLRTNWNHTMSCKCRYDRKDQDPRCSGCQVYYDQEYVEGLK